MMRRVSKAVMRRGGHGSQVRPTSGRQAVRAFADEDYRRKD